MPGEMPEPGSMADLAFRLLMQWERAWEQTLAIVDLERDSMAWYASRQMFGHTQHVRDLLRRGDLDDAACEAIYYAAQALLFSGFVQATGGAKMQAALAAKLDELKPLADRGQAELEASRRAEEATHGPRAEREAKYAHWQAVVDEIAAERDDIPFRRRNGSGDDVLTLAARRLHVAKGTLKDHVKNPKRPP